VADSLRIVCEVLSVRFGVKEDMFCRGLAAFRIPANG
jgi:hypothetical protein